MITVYYIPKIENYYNQDVVKTSNKVLIDSAFMLQTFCQFGLNNDFQSQDVEIVLAYNSRNEIFWTFGNEVSEVVKNRIRETLKRKNQIKN